jgi:hypothetical protein
MSLFAARFSGASWRAKVRDFLYGMLGMEFARHALEMRASLETLFMLATIGDMIGVPIMPPYYSLRLLPFIVPLVDNWRRRMLRERDLMDSIFG